MSATSPRAEFARLMRFGAVGVGSNLSLYLVFLGLLWLGVGPVVAAGLCYVAGVALSYTLNRRWTFASTASHAADLPKFIAAYGIGFVATLVFIGLLLTVLPPALAQVINIGLTALVIYTSLRLLRFGGSHDG